MLRKSCVIKSERIDGMERYSNSTITNTFTVWNNTWRKE